MGPWHKPWAAGHVAGPVSRPLRSNGKPYSGINVIMLWATAMERGYSAPIWMTFKQAKELGAHVRKGEMGDDAYADKFKGFDWKTEEDAFMDGYHKHAHGGEHVTYERLRKMGTNGFQEPAIGVDEDGRIIGTPRLYTDGTFSTDDGRARFMDAPWRGLQAPGKKEEKAKFRFLINNGRANQVWQSAYLDVDNDFVMERWPYPFIEMNPDDMAELGVKEGDLVEVYNDSGSTQAMVYPTSTAKRNETFMLFAFPTGVQGNVVNAGTNELIIPNYKQTWGNIRKIADAPKAVHGLSFKSKEYVSG